MARFSILTHASSRSFIFSFSLKNSKMSLALEKRIKFKKALSGAGWGAWPEHDTSFPLCPRLVLFHVGHSGDHEVRNGEKQKQKLGLEEKELKLQTNQNFNTSKNLSS